MAKFMQFAYIFVTFELSM